MTITDAVIDTVWDTFFEPPPIRRDRWGRYQVVGVDGRLTGYTRATTLAKALDDQSALVDWSARVACLGMADTPALVEQFKTVDRDDRQALRKLAETAKAAGGGIYRRDLGSHLHDQLHRFWTQPQFRVEQAHAGDVQAVVDLFAIHGLTPLDGYFERLIVCDELQTAGMPDLLVTDSAGHIYICDYKTGASIQYGALGWAQQLAIYANADSEYVQGAAVDGSDDVRLEWPDVDRQNAYIVHVEPFSGVATLHQLDIAAGWEALHLAVQVREWRKRKSLLTAARVPVPGVAVEPAAVNMHTERREWLLERIETIKTVNGALDTLLDCWPQDVATLRQSDSHSDAELDLVAAAISKTEATWRMPFADTIDPKHVEATTKLSVDDPRVVDVLDRIGWLPDDILDELRDDFAALRLPSLNRGQQTAAQVGQVAELLDHYETQYQLRKDRLQRITVTTGVHVDLWFMAAGVNVANRPLFSALDVDLVEAVIEAHTVGAVTMTDGQLTIETDTASAVLVARHGTKQRAVAAAKRAGAIRNLSTPSRFADLLGDLQLVCLTAAATPNTPISTNES